MRVILSRSRVRGFAASLTPKAPVTIRLLNWGDTVFTEQAPLELNMSVPFQPSRVQSVGYSLSEGASASALDFKVLRTTDDGGAEVSARLALGAARFVLLWGHDSL